MTHLSRSWALRKGVVWPPPPNNPLQRSGHDKMHAPDWCSGVVVSGYAPQVQRAAAERDR